MVRAMSKKTIKTTKTVKGDKGARWTVRGVPSKLQKAAGDAARAQGQTLGQWLSSVLDQATMRAPGAPAPVAAAWEETIEERVARLETALLGDGQERVLRTGPVKEPRRGEAQSHPTA